MHITSLSQLSIVAKDMQAKQQARMLDDRKAQVATQTIPQLRELAKRLHITLSARMKKDEIVQLVAQKQMRLESEAQMATPVERPKRPMYSLIGFIAPTIRASGNGQKFNTFLTRRANNRPNLYVSMSAITRDKLMRRISEQNIRLDRPVQVVGYFYQNNATNADGIRHPEAFHITGIRPASDAAVADQAQHMVQI